MDFEVRVIIARDRNPDTAHLGRWRLTAIGSSMPVIPWLDAEQEACPVAQPDWADLETYMFGLDAPYTRKLVGDEAFEVVAKGRSAIPFMEWCSDLIKDGKRTT